MKDETPLKPSENVLTPVYQHKRPFTHNQQLIWHRHIPFTQSECPQPHSHLIEIDRQYPRITAQINNVKNRNRICWIALCPKKCFLHSSSPKHLLSSFDVHVVCALCRCFFCLLWGLQRQLRGGINTCIKPPCA